MSKRPGGTYHEIAVSEASAIGGRFAAASKQRVVDPAPVQPPSRIDHIDRMVAQQDRANRAAAIRQRIENDWIESHFEKGPRIEVEYNPFENSRIRDK